jgi:WD40 repeat protein
MTLEIEQTHALADIGQVVFVDSGDRVLMAESKPESTEFSVADLESGDESWLFEEPVDALPYRRVGTDRFVYAARNRPGCDRVEIRRIEDFELAASFEPGSVAALASDPAGTIVAVADREGKVTVWNAADGKRVALVIQSDPAVEGLSVSADGRWIVARDMGFDALINRVDGPPDAFRRLGLSDGVAIACHPIEPVVAVDLGGRIAVYDLESARPTRELALDDESTDAISELCFSRDGKLLLSGSLGNGVLALWDFASGGLLAKVGELGDSAFSLAFHADGRRFAACRCNAGALFRISDG